MPTFQVTCRELVYVDRTYEIEAEDAASAKAKIKKSRGDAGTFVDEQVQGSHSFDGVLSVFDDNGNEVET